MSAKEGYQLILEGNAKKGEKSKFAINKPVAGQWLKLEILTNWGHAQYTELMELEAYGEAVGEKLIPKSIEGVFNTNYDLMWLKQNKTQIEGCYDHDGGRLTGTTDGRVIRFQWTEAGPQVGTAIMVLTSDNAYLNGMWYENGQYQGLWYGSRVTDGTLPQCVAKMQVNKDDNSIGRSLDTAGRAILYGIYFDHDSSEIKSESLETLTISR